MQDSADDVRTGINARAQPTTLNLEQQVVVHLCCSAGTACCPLKEARESKMNKSSRACTHYGQITISLLLIFRILLEYINNVFKMYLTGSEEIFQCCVRHASAVTLTTMARMHLHPPRLDAMYPGSSSSEKAGHAQTVNNGIDIIFLCVVGCIRSGVGGRGLQCMCHPEWRVVQGIKMANQMRSIWAAAGGSIEGSGAEGIAGAGGERRQG